MLASSRKGRARSLEHGSVLTLEMDFKLVETRNLEVNMQVKPPFLFLLSHWVLLKAENAVPDRGFSTAFGVRLAQRKTLEESDPPSSVEDEIASNTGWVAWR